VESYLGFLILNRIAPNTPGTRVVSLVNTEARWPTYPPKLATLFPAMSWSNPDFVGFIAIFPVYPRCLSSTRWCPPVISWFIIPLTIDISPINHSYGSYKPT